MQVTAMNIISLLAYLIIGPLLGGLLAGIDRKITARMQGRFGPPILQPFYDVFKLFEKEPVTVNRGQDFYVMSFLVFIIITGGLIFSGENLLLAIFTLTTAGAFLVVAAYSSNSAYSQVGGERELLQMMAYEPMVLIAAIGLYMVKRSFFVSAMVAGGRIPILYTIGIFIGFVFILTIKFRKSPFDLAFSHHAHQELVAGLKTEFSGRTLAAIEVAHWYENIFLLGIVFLFFANGTWYMALIGVVVALGLYFIEILIDNVYARMKWLFTLKASWLVTIVFGGVNLMVLYYLYLAFWQMQG